MRVAYSLAGVDEFVGGLEKVLEGDVAFGRLQKMRKFTSVLVLRGSEGERERETEIFPRTNTTKGGMYI